MKHALLLLLAATPFAAQLSFADGNRLSDKDKALICKTLHRNWSVEKFYEIKNGRYVVGALTEACVQNSTFTTGTSSKRQDGSKSFEFSFKGVLPATQKEESCHGVFVHHRSLSGLSMSEVFEGVTCEGRSTN